MAEFLKKLDASGVKYHITAPPAAGIKQINVNDPEGNHIHIDFLGGRAHELTLVFTKM